jgi:CAAX amino terminal protease family.
MGKDIIEGTTKSIISLKINNKKNIVQVVLFCLIVLSSGWLGVFLNSLLTKQPDGNSAGMGLWLVLPFFSAIMIRVFHRDWKDAGLRLKIRGNIKWYLFSILVYPIIAFLITVAGIPYGLENLAIPDIKWFLVPFISSLCGNFIKNIFEEFCWRGYLTPKLIAFKINDWLLYLIVGEVWALWHMAYYLVLLPDQNFEDTSRITALLSGCFIMLFWAVPYVELYRVTKSIWPCVLLHTVANTLSAFTLGQAIHLPLTEKAAFWFGPVNGAVSVVLILCIGLLMRKLRRKKESELEIIDEESDRESL